MGSGNNSNWSDRGSGVAWTRAASQPGCLGLNPGPPLVCGVTLGKSPHISVPSFPHTYVVGLTIVSTSHRVLRLKVLMVIKCQAKSQQFLYNCSYVLVMFLGAVLTYYIDELDLISQQPCKIVASLPLISQTRELRLRKDHSPSASELVGDIVRIQTQVCKARAHDPVLVCLPRTVLLCQTMHTAPHCPVGI